MESSGQWERTILSDLEHEHLVAEVTFEGQFMFMLDREDGRDSVCISFLSKDGASMIRIPLEKFNEQLVAAVTDLCL